MATAVTGQSTVTAARNSAVASFLKGSPKKLLINGKWVAPKSGKTFESINPATEDVLALIAEGDKADVDEAVKAARKALDEGKWSQIGPHQRAQYLFKIAELIDQHTDELAELETLDNGKGVAFSKAFDVPGAAETFRYYAGWCTKTIWRNQSFRPLDVQLHAARAGGRMRPDHSVEFPAADGGVEAGAGAGMWQYRNPEAGRADATYRPSIGRVDPRGRPSRGSGQYHHRLRARSW